MEWLVILHQQLVLVTIRRIILLKTRAKLHRLGIKGKKDSCDENLGYVKDQRRKVMPDEKHPALQ